jgi:hypothetical protein
MTPFTTFDPAVLVRAGFPALGRRFLLWRTFPPRRDGGKPVKSPCSTMGRKINGTDERRWLDFDAGVRLARRHQLGLGVALGWGLAGLDLDHCLDDAGALLDRPTDVGRIVKHFPTYLEVSPSGDGLHAYFFSEPFVSAIRTDRGVELYGGVRWFAVTGRPFTGSVRPIAECTTAAHALARVLRPPSPPRPARPAAPPSGDARARLEDCEPIRTRPSHLGGTIYTLRRCPFTHDEHTGGGPWALVFDDGGVLFECNRSIHGPLREIVPPPQRTVVRHAEGPSIAAGATIRTTTMKETTR